MEPIINWLLWNLLSFAQPSWNLPGNAGWCVESQKVDDCQSISITLTGRKISNWWNVMNAVPSIIWLFSSNSNEEEAQLRPEWQQDSKYAHQMEQLFFPSLAEGKSNSLAHNWHRFFQDRGSYIKNSLCSLLQGCFKWKGYENLGWIVVWDNGPILNWSYPNICWHLI